MLESENNEQLDISYIYIGNLSESAASRIKEADYIFVNAKMNSANGDKLDWIISNMNADAELWGIGTKEYGQSNGNVYNRRLTENYYDYTATYTTVADEYQREIDTWGDHYIDFIAPVRRGDGRVTVFTDDHKYISQDTRHLTQAGARYYARILDFKKIFKELDD